MPNCPKCGTPYKVGHKFCKKCGTGLGISPEVSAKIDILGKKISNEPLNASLYIELGNVYRKHGRLQEAVVEYEKAASTDHSSIEAHLRSGDVYFQLKQLDKAERSYQTALNLNPKSKEIQLSLFNIYYASRNLEKAIELGEKLVKSDPKSVEVHFALKKIYLKKEMKEKAFKEMQAISALLPDDKQASMELGIQFLAKEQYEKASKCYERVLKIDSIDPDARFRMGELSCLKGDYNEAIQYLENIDEKLLTSYRPFAQIYRAFAYASMEEMELATIEVKSVIPPEYDKLTTQRRKLLAEAYHKTGSGLIGKDLSTAIDYLGQATEYEPKNSDYEKKLEEAVQRETFLKNRRTRRVLFATGSIVLLIGLVGASWYLSHGKILVEANPPADEIWVDGKRYIKATDKYVKITVQEENIRSGPSVRSSVVAKCRKGESYRFLQEVNGWYKIRHGNRVAYTHSTNGSITTRGISSYRTPSIFFGSHKIKVKKDGYEDWETEVNVGYGKTVQVDASLIPIYGGLKVTSIPRDAQVYIDRKLMGKSPLTVNEILAIDHTIKLELEGYKESFKSITISPDRILNLNLTLKGLQGEWHGILLNNMEGSELYRMYRGKLQWAPPSYISGGGKYPIVLKIEQSGNKVAIDYNVKGIYKHKGRILGKISGNSFTTFKTFVGFRQSDGTISKIYGQKIKLEVTISANWDRIEGYTYDSEYNRTKWWAERQK